MSPSNRLFPSDLAQLPSMLFGAPAFRVEEYTEGSTYVVRAEVPGLDPDKDITVSQFGDRLQIRIERTEERVDKAHSEFHYGSLARSVQLPMSAEEEGTNATYCAGILEIRVKLAGKVTPGRQIPVSATRPTTASAAKHK
jgi:HSP20 family protein